MDHIEQNCLSYWYPRLVESGVRTPLTRIYETDLDLTPLVDGQVVRGFGAFCDELCTCMSAVGGPPAFLRTGCGSGKHEWSSTCYLNDFSDLPGHVRALVEWSLLVDMLGLPTNVWVVREFLPLKFAFHAFRGLPISVERRYFVRDGRVECHHPYWPVGALREAHHRIPLPADWQAQLRQVNQESAEEVAYLSEQSARVAAKLPGYWSLDWAQTVGGEWYAIDMARGENSWHLECPYAPKENRG
ncbi:MAG: hypothetical protein KAU28_01160 [Phycisphaerae bacterium]|nr:hypothetical protein [Phycisphaerae bacterium]